MKPNEGTGSYINTMDCIYNMDRVYKTKYLRDDVTYLFFFSGAE